jgi:hypothetical protein
MPTMVNPMDDIARQARQGSVAAIIQVLNEKLTDSGVRTRAILVEGVLQLLCEAPQLEQLEKPILVNQIRQILELLQPRGIRRVKINSRIVREQQLLWLEEINRDPENQLLWSEEIRLSRPSPFQRLSQDWKTQKSLAPFFPKVASSVTLREKRQFWRGIFGGAVLCLLLLVIAGLLHDRLGLSLFNRLQTSAVDETDAAEREFSTASSAADVPANPPASSSANALSDESIDVPIENQAESQTQSQLENGASDPVPIAVQEDPFVQAVRLAEKAAADGQVAQSSADWLELATRWQRASDLMSEVAPADGRYQTAQDRMQVYRQNSEAALQQAQRRQEQTGQPASNL